MSNNAFLPAESIARICHAANAAYSAEIADNFNHLPWDDLPQHLRDTTIAGVKARQDNPDMSPADMHENWLKSKREQGYSYSSVKDDDAKTHPCMLPYEELPTEQRIKDAIFSAIVDAISREV